MSLVSFSLISCSSHSFFFLCSSFSFARCSLSRCLASCSTLFFSRFASFTWNHQASCLTMTASGWGAFPTALNKRSEKLLDDSARRSVWTGTTTKTRAEAVLALSPTVYTDNGASLSTSISSRFGASSSSVSSLSHCNLPSGTSQSSKSTSSTPCMNTGSFFFLLPLDVSVETRILIFLL
jgi:hypothetical protein